MEWTWEAGTVPASHCLPASNFPHEGVLQEKLASFFMAQDQRS